MNDFFRVLFTPKCWMQNEDYSPAWDAHLNKLLDTHEFENVDKHTAEIGGITVWTSNHPYASFHPYGHTEDTEIKVRPKRSTMLRANDKLVRVVAPLADEVRIEKLIATTATQKADLSIVN